MSIFAFTCQLYAMANLPENVFLALLMLLPFFVAMAALTFDQEKLTSLQILSISAAYFGILLLTNPEIFMKENIGKIFVWEDVKPFLKENWLSILLSIGSSIFQAFNYMAARRISTQVHTCVETMYIGIVSLMVYSFGLLFYKPSYFRFWECQYTLEQALYTIITSLLYYVSQESLSAALAILKAGAVATFTYLSVLITFLGYKFFKLIIYKKNLIGKTKVEIKEWLYESDEHMDQAKATQICREEFIGIVLIFSGVFLLLISFKDD